MGAFVLAVDWAGVTISSEPMSRAELALGGFASAGWQRINAQGFSASRAISADVSDWAIQRDLIVAMDGRFSLGCRTRLRAKLAGVAEAASCDDESLAALAWSVSGESAAAQFEGDFALAIFDVKQAQLWLMRSPSGARGLHFVFERDRVLVATRPSAALMVAGRSLREHSDSVAAYFALRAPPSGYGYFEGVTAMLPGATCSFDAHGMRAGQASAVAAKPKLQFADDAEAREAWLASLSAAVSEALSGWRQPGVMLSGGLDSSALAAIGMRSRTTLCAYSWTLPQTPAADEHEWIAATTRHLGLESRLFNGDHDWPLARLAHWPIEDDGPPANPYLWLQQHLYCVAESANCDALISGNFGDHLYPEAGAWMRSGLSDRGISWVLGQELKLLRQQGLSALWREPGWRRLARQDSIAAANTWQAPHWLQPKWGAQLLGTLGTDTPGAGADSAEAIQDAELGRRFHAMHNIELLAPYRDPRVVAFAAALPAHYQYRNGQSKSLTREAMRGLLPESVRTRRKGGSLAPFFRIGVLQRSATEVTQLLDAPDARWPNYIMPSALRRARERAFTESDLLLIWLCVSYELWWRSHWGRGGAVLASRVNRCEVSEAFRE